MEQGTSDFWRVNVTLTVFTCCSLSIIFLFRLARTLAAEFYGSRHGEYTHRHVSAVLLSDIRDKGRAWHPIYGYDVRQGLIHRWTKSL